MNRHDTDAHDAHEPQRRRILAGGLAAAGAVFATAASAASRTMAPGAGATSDSNGRFEGKVVLITGATSGIGKAAAESFAKEGAKVFFCGRRQSLGEQVATAIRDSGGEATFMRADVREADQVKAFVDAAIAKHRRIDIAFNNAGNDLPPKPLGETGIEAFDELFATHARGVFLSMRNELPYMVASGGGVIVNMASIGAHNVYPGVGPYTAAKAAIVHLTRTAAAEYGDKGIRVASVSPGWVDTPMMDRAVRDWGLPSKAAAVASTTMKRAATAQEVADVVMYLASGQAAYVSGDDLKITGGWPG